VESVWARPESCGLGNGAVLVVVCGSSFGLDRSVVVATSHYTACVKSRSHSMMNRDDVFQLVMGP
jgi:hypothetical protein